MNKRDLNYYRSRFVAEKQAARESPHPIVARRHSQLAEEYLSLIEANGETATEEPAH